MEPSGAQRGSVRIPPGSDRVTDADEEVFILYSDLQASSGSDTGEFRGLGYVDSSKDTVSIQFHLSAPNLALTEPPAALLPGKIKQRNKKSRNNKVKEDQDMTVEIKLAQDKTALRSRKGDTGSVLWRASVDLTQQILEQFHRGPSPDSLFDKELLSTHHVIELGAGTGLLAIALSRFVRHYTLTDMDTLLPLLRKNVASNFNGWPDCPKSSPGSNISVESLDWLLLKATVPSRRHLIMPSQSADVILVVDCIYHPSLLPALVETIDYLTIPERTAVLVVMELRAVDVTREFLELWLSKSASWEIHRINGILGRPYVIWLGWKAK